MCVCVCVFSSCFRTHTEKPSFTRKTSNNNKAHTHTHVYYTITVARFLAIDDHHGGVFFQKSKKKNSRQRKTTTNTVSPLSLYLIHVVFFLILLSFVSIDEYLLPRRCQLSFPFFLVFLIPRSAQINRAIHYITHKLPPLACKGALFHLVGGRNQWQELGAQHTFLQLS